MVSYPALHVNVPDLGATYARAQAVRNAEVRNSLLREKLAEAVAERDRKNRLTEMRRQMFAGEPTDAQVTNALAAGGGPTPRAAATLDRSTRIDMNNPAVRAYVAEDPKGGTQILEAIAKANEAERKRIADVNMQRMIGAAHLLEVERTKGPEAAAAEYPAVIEHFRSQGSDVSNMPPTYDRAAVERQFNLGRSLKQIIAQQKPVNVPPRNALVNPQSGKEIYVNKQRPGTGQDPARIREAERLVELEVYKTFKEAYAATRTRVETSEADARAKGLAWIASQKNDLNEPRYSTPEEIDAALRAYMMFRNGDSPGAIAALKALEEAKGKKAAEAANKPGWVRRVTRSLFGSEETTKPTSRTEKAPGEPPPSGLTGDGTRESPYVAATQDHVDWFKKNAHSGAVISVLVDGKTKLYRKK